MLSIVNWTYLGVMAAVFAFALAGSYVSCRHRIGMAVGVAAVITAMFVFASHFPAAP